MHFEKDYTYHVYNRSNQTVFKTQDNYNYFLKKFKQHILPYVDVLAWCLMPNHFHFMIVVKEEGVKYVEDKHLPNTQVLSKKFGTFLSSFTKAYNKMYKKRGQLWAHNTKAKQLNYTNNNYPITCFRYIHENPKDAGLVRKLIDWEYSSFKDLLGVRKGTIVNKELVYEYFNIDEEYFRNWVEVKIKDEDLKEIF